eukprot:5445701-Pleurochrysis_carterae.AAC.1
MCDKAHESVRAAAGGRLQEAEHGVARRHIHVLRVCGRSQPALAREVERALKVAQGQHGQHVREGEAALRAKYATMRRRFQGQGHASLLFIIVRLNNAQTRTLTPTLTHKLT